jgi:hypothetical protein
VPSKKAKCASTDSERLAAEFARYAPAFRGLADTSYGFRETCPCACARTRPLRIGSWECEARRLRRNTQAARLLDGKSTARPLQFVLQANDPDSGCRDALRDFSPALRQCGSSPEALGSEEYRALVSSLDVVLLPYWQEVYAHVLGYF